MVTATLTSSFSIRRIRFFITKCIETGGYHDKPGRFRAGIEWSICNPNTVLFSALSNGFNGIIATDYNGDGRADIVATWAYIPLTPNATVFRVLTVLGTDTGLATPTEDCQAPPLAVHDYAALRQGDITRDGPGDMILSYQGRALPFGRDIRFRLGSNQVSGSRLQVLAADNYTYPFPSLIDPAPHMNQWDFVIADINGDGIADYLQSYEGQQGNIFNFASATLMA